MACQGLFIACNSLLQSVTNCYNLLQTVSDCLQSVNNLFQVDKNCYKFCLIVTGKYKLVKTCKNFLILCLTSLFKYAI